MAPGHRERPPAPGVLPGDDDAAQRRTAVARFFDTEGEYGWWGDVYDSSLPRGFFSHEMTRRRELVLALLREHALLRPGVRVLECGCGPGGILRAIATTGCRTTGINLNPRLLRAVRSTDARSSCAAADVERLPFRDGAFDVVLCVGVLSYLREDEAAVWELARVVRPGGAVVVGLPGRFLAAKALDPFYPLVWLPARIARALRTRGRGASHAPGVFHHEEIRRYGLRTLAPLYARAGLVERETASVSFGPLTLWRRELLPLSWSIALSDRLSALARRRGFGFVAFTANHWVTLLTRGAARGEGPP